MKQKLIELLKTVPEIKKDLEELKFGCYIQHSNGHIFRVNECPSEKQRIRNNISVGLMEIIGNPLEERHLRMYFESVGIDIDINSNGNIGKDNGFNSPICKIDNSKPFDQQTEEVDEAIFNFLSK